MMGMIMLYTHARQILFCGIGLLAVSILIGWLGVFILHRGVLPHKKLIMYSGWVVAGIGCVVYILGWWLIMSNGLLPDGPRSDMVCRVLLILPLAVVMGIVYATKVTAKKREVYKIVINTIYVLELIV